ncbi:MAG: hypothetical protein ACJ75J_09060 [Cytophagaceae bacterium]
MRKGLILIFIVCAGNVFAQVPGFQGKRFSAEGSLMFNMALRNLNENFNTGITSFNKRYQGAVEYIIGRDVSFGVMAGFMNSGLKYHHVAYYPNGFPGGNSSSYTNDQYRINCPMAGLYFKFFKFHKKGSIAPYGTYAKLGLLRMMISGDFVSTDNNTGATPETLQKTPMTFLSYGFGKQFIIKGRFIARVGADFALNGLIFTSFNPANVAEAAKRRVSNAMIFNLEAGIGILLF